MAGRQSAAVDQCLKAIDKGGIPAQEAAKRGLSLSTIYRAIRRQRIRLGLIAPDADQRKRKKVAVVPVFPAVSKAKVETEVPPGRDPGRPTAVRRWPA